MAWLGIDIGGANLKAADSRDFALWQKPEKLAHELRAMIADAPADIDRLATTMTGELADCFESKAVGVCTILDAFERAADGRHTRVYLTNGKFVTPEVARRNPERAAASNWYALASFASRFVGEGQRGLLIDVGSTTTDLIPLDSNGPKARGRTDTERLVHGELLYTGVHRSPVCGVTRVVPYRDQQLFVAQELFATTLDAYLILGKLSEDPTSNKTADGRSATKRNSRSRLARMICADSVEFNHRDAVVMSDAICQAQLDCIESSLKRCWNSAEVPDVVVFSGCGDFLGSMLMDRMEWKPKVVPLSDKIGRRASTCGPAYALAVIATEFSRKS